MNYGREFGGANPPRLVMDPSEPSFRFRNSFSGRIPSHQPQDLEVEKKNWLRKIFSEKKRYSTREAKERFPGPDTSSLTAFLFSLLSCSGHGAHHFEDSSSDDISDTNVDPPVLLSLKCSNNHSHTIQNLVLRGESELENNNIKQNASDVFTDAPRTDNDSDWQLITKHDLGDFEKDAAVSSQKKLLPRMSDTSFVLPDTIVNSLYSALPTLVHGRRWRLLYSTWKHGISLLSLYRSVAHISGPWLLVVSDDRGAVFGGLLPSLIPSSKKKYQGTNETFVFTNVLGKLHIFHATGLNHYYVLCTNDSLAFGGGGHFALYLDEELLHGSSGPCETFGNCCLAQTEEFVIKHVELWGFVHESRYTSRATTFKDLVRAPDFNGSSDPYLYREVYEWP